jgi:hypothetical protein
MSAATNWPTLRQKAGNKGKATLSLCATKIIELVGIDDVDGLKTLLRHHISSWQPILADAILTRGGRSFSLCDPVTRKQTTIVIVLRIYRGFNSIMPNSVLRGAGSKRSWPAPRRGLCIAIANNRVG